MDATKISEIKAEMKKRAEDGPTTDKDGGVIKIAKKYTHGDFIYTYLEKTDGTVFEVVLKWDLKKFADLMNDRSVSAADITPAMVPATKDLTDEDWQKLYDDLFGAEQESTS